MNADIVIIGGGASGYAAAVEVGKICPDAEIVIAEKLARTGKKLIATGNGKCNLSNVFLSEKRYHGSVDAMKVISKTPDYYDFFVKELDIMCVSGSEGREGGIYPHSNSATTVVNAFRLKIDSLGIKEICNFEIKSISQNKGKYILKSEDNQIICKKIIIACGGYAGTSFGTDGSMLRILKNMGYKTAKICPAVAPLRVSSDRLKGLKGVRAKGKISAVCGGKVLKTETGEIQFNENNISGICVFNLAYLFQQYEGKMILRADLFPESDEKNLISYLERVRKNRSEYSLEELLTGIFVKNLAVYLVKNTVCRPMTDKINSVTDDEIKRLAKAVKCLEFEVTGCSSWQNAQATCGGIHNECVTENLESKLHKGIYFCGEILDTVGDCGGFNLQWAWSSGIWAGRHCAESLKGGEK